MESNPRMVNMGQHQMVYVWVCPRAGAGARTLNYRKYRKKTATAIIKKTAVAAGAR